MRIISFLLFRDNCKRVENVRVSSVDRESVFGFLESSYKIVKHCRLGHPHTKYHHSPYSDSVMVPYSPCKEKYCPILNKCKPLNKQKELG
ncbi:hypothetical protein LCGC14_1227920 [marine sediment metagenome]|uniref:Uncharacterized protein n=1 Tax=marine sediment metagenome TaxID=412755 RepID=A0A0F9LDF9_9ZZZZ